MDRSPAPPSGIYPPCVTFFTESDDFDHPSIEKHVLRLAQGGVAGFVVHGSNGEAMHLTDEERITNLRAIRKVLDTNNFNHLKIIAGCGTQSRNATIKLTKEAHEAGADFALILPPNYWAAAMTMPTLIKYYREVADASPLPVVIYNFPQVTNGISFDSDTILELAKHPNIVGCKLTCGHIGNLHRICAHTKPEEFAGFGGKGEVLLHALVAGAAGCVPALGNLFPKLHVALIEAYNKGDLPRAKQLQNILGDADLANQKLGVSGLKLAISELFGYGSGRARSPLLDGNPVTVNAQKPAFEKALEMEKAL